MNLLSCVQLHESQARLWSPQWNLRHIIGMVFYGLWWSVSYPDGCEPLVMRPRTQVHRHTTSHTHKQEVRALTHPRSHTCTSMPSHQDTRTQPHTQPGTSSTHPHLLSQPHLLLKRTRAKCMHILWIFWSAFERASAVDHFAGQNWAWQLKCLIIALRRVSCPFSLFWTCSVFSCFSMFSFQVITCLFLLKYGPGCQRLAYPAVVAGGSNALVLHYIANDDTLKLVGISVSSFNIAQAQWIGADGRRRWIQLLLLRYQSHLARLWQIYCGTEGSVRSCLACSNWVHRGKDSPSLPSSSVISNLFFFFFFFFFPVVLIISTMGRPYTMTNKAF